MSGTTCHNFFQRTCHSFEYSSHWKWTGQGQKPVWLVWNCSRFCFKIWYFRSNLSVTSIHLYSVVTHVFRMGFRAFFILVIILIEWELTYELHCIGTNSIMLNKNGRCASKLRLVSTETWYKRRVFDFVLQGFQVPVAKSDVQPLCSV